MKRGGLRAQGVESKGDFRVYAHCAVGVEDQGQGSGVRDRKAPVVVRAAPALRKAPAFFELGVGRRSEVVVGPGGPDAGIGVADAGRWRGRRRANRKPVQVVVAVVPLAHHRVDDVEQVAVGRIAALAGDEEKGRSRFAGIPPFAKNAKGRGTHFMGGSRVGHALPTILAQRPLIAKNAMNGAQLLIAHRYSLRLMTGPPAPALPGIKFQLLTWLLAVV